MRLIDLDAFREEYDLREHCEDCGRRNKKACDYPSYSARDFCGWLDDAPTVDAVQVVHGRWIGKRYNFQTYETETVPYDPLSFEDLDDLTCSACGRPALLNGHEEEVPSNYCPNCGAKMDLEEHNATDTE